MTKLTAGVVLAIALALAAVSFASAQGGPDVQIGELDCNSDPELVVIENVGDAGQDLEGWELRSDPPDSEVFDLRDLGTSLLAGTSVTIQSGPSASSVFTWGTDEVFRDSDPTDYVNLVDNTGATVQQVSCAVQPPATPSPEPSPPADVPNGGGPPPAPGDALSSAMLVLIGGSIAAVGVATLALPRLRLRPSPVGPPRVQRVGREDSGTRPVSTTLGLAMLALAAVVFLLMRRRRG